MEIRLKSYYSENQIVKNLFTNGQELMHIKDFDEYVGFYHRYTTGEIFTEPEWDPVRSKRLITYRNISEMQKRYYDLKHFTTNPLRGKRKKINNPDEYYRYTHPMSIKRQLTDREIRDGKIFRYFVSKRNERARVFYEIDQKQAVTITSTRGGLNQFLFEVVTIPWKTDGPQYDIYKNDILTIQGVVDTNLRIVERYSKKYPLLRRTISGPRELTVYENRRRLS